MPLSDQASAMCNRDAMARSYRWPRAFELRGDRLSPIDLYFDPSPFTGGTTMG